MKRLFSFVSIAALSFTLTAQSVKQITNEDIFVKGTFRQENVYGMNWLKSGEHYAAYGSGVEGNQLFRYEIKTGKKLDMIFDEDELVPEGQSKPIKTASFFFSPDESKILFTTEVEYIYRYSTREFCYVYDVATKKLTPLSTNGKQRLEAFSPDSKKIAFVRDNNIFIKDLVTGTETQVTQDGVMNKIINGGTDWVYEEEFALPNGMYWSPDGKKLAFYRFDESMVPEFQMTVYGNGLYPGEDVFKYPKAGEKNSIVSIHIYDLASKATIPVNVGTETNQYIPRIEWTNSSSVLSVIRMNRLQNKQELMLVNSADGTSNVILTETSAQYLEVCDDLTFLPDGKTFLWSSDRDGRTHLYHYNMDGTLVKQITKGWWDVISFYGYDEKSKVLYYQSNEGLPYTRSTFSIKLDGSGKKKLSMKDGSNTANFSTGMKYFMNYHSTANTPNYITMNSADGKELRVLRSNENLMNTMHNYGFAKKEFFNIKNADGDTLYGWMIKPINFDPNKKYPVLMHVYGGPGHNTVNDAWDRDLAWHEMLTQKGYIVVSVDNRGTEYRGAKFKKSTYGQMGKLESADQIDAAKWLRNQSYVDRDRIGIQGWSYGGYMSSLCLAVGSDFFKMAISIAPVGNWRFYDSIYTERYMGLPQDNAKGYDAYSPTENMDKVRGKLLLVHGTADDNVHFQNSVAMANALIAANVQFDFFMYPDQNHGMGSGRYHLYVKMTNYVLQNL
ncbi:MAG: S9 family peptidase [Bacteroidia bacterium]|nr:S9 family peptidase [Bacteroidia bacterium]